jgi:hypothetical protein
MNRKKGMPRQEASKKENVNFGASPSLISVASELSEGWDKPLSEIHREAWERGLRLMVSEDNALRVSKKLLRRSGKILEAIALLESSGASPEVVQMLKESIGA